MFEMTAATTQQSVSSINYKVTQNKIYNIKMNDITADSLIISCLSSLEAMRSLTFKINFN